MSMKPMWAPWRMEFLTEKKTTSGCVFCDLLREDDDRKNLILHRSERVFVILNKYPYNNGHLMIVPNRHTNDLISLPDDDTRDLWAMSKVAVKAIQEAYKPEGYNLGMNLGVSGGAGIRDHLHLHVVPRWLGDTNFMPVLAETKSMPQHLLASYDQLNSNFSAALKSFEVRS